MKTFKFGFQALFKSVMFYLAGYALVIGLTYSARELGPHASRFWDVCTWIILNPELPALGAAFAVYYFDENVYKIQGDKKYIIWAMLFYFLLTGFLLEIAFLAGERIMSQTDSWFWWDLNDFANFILDGSVVFTIACTILKFIDDGNERLEAGTVVALKVILVLVLLVFAISLAGSAGIIHEYQESKIVIMTQGTPTNPECFAYITPFENLFKFPLEIRCFWYAES
ncbi:MAG TPA: hypothetical protein VFI61_01765 [Patescibacteria group bacterium]|nr:hypothetical protein [Patescibacteria group bacterium]